MSYEIRSQKARGIRNMEHAAYRLGFPIIDGIGPLDASVPIPDNTLLPFPKTFARPCPVRPRHGFVESRLVKDGADLEVLRRAVFEIEEDAEIILMPYSNAEMNAIITPSALVLGPGHDGATSGHNAITLPLEGKLPIGDRNQYGLGEDDDPYIELVTEKYQSRPRMVQVRGGPRLAGIGDDYVPKVTVVTEVITLDGTEDLVEWETRAKQYGEQPGVVVHHIGGSLSSHFGVHCVLNEVPYLTTPEAPAVGDRLESTVGERTKWGAEERERLATYLRHYDGGWKPNTNLGELAPIGMAALHGLPALMYSKTDASLRFAALGMIAFARVITGLPLGELRYLNGKSKGGSTIMEMLRQHLPPKYNHNVFNGIQRDNIYEEASKLDLNIGVRALHAAEAGFLHGPWGGGGYGGVAWYQCAHESADLIRMMMNFGNKPTEKLLVDMLSKFNIVMNLAHNGGWWFNKVMQQETADNIAKTPAIGAISKLVLQGLSSELPTPATETFDPALEQRKAIDAEVKNWVNTQTTYPKDIFKAGKPPKPPKPPKYVSIPAKAWCDGQDTDTHRFLGVVQVRIIDPGIDNLRWQIRNANGPSSPHEAQGACKPEFRMLLEHMRSENITSGYKSMFGGSTAVYHRVAVYRAKDGDGVQLAFKVKAKAPIAKVRAMTEALGGHISAKRIASIPVKPNLLPTNTLHTLEQIAGV